MGYCINRADSDGMSMPIGTQEERERFLNFAKGLMQAVIDDRKECFQRYPSTGLADEIQKYEEAYSELWGNVRSWEDAFDCFQRFLTDVWHSSFVVETWNDRAYITFDFDRGGKWHGDCEELFLKAFAPFAKEGAWIGFEGEDNELWSYVFDGKGSYRTHKPTIDWTGSKVDRELLRKKLLEHRGHNVEIACYGDPRDPQSVTLEDLDTNEIILDSEIYTIVAKQDA